MTEVINRVVDEVIKHSEVLTVILFGSYAKGEDTPLSDVDICVILSDVNEKAEADIGSMYSSEIDLVLFHRLSLHVQFEVLKYGKVLFCRNEEMLDGIKLKVLRNYLEMSNFYERIGKRVLNENY